MKKITALLTTLALILGLCACSTKNELTTWQEQFDLGARYLSEGNYEAAILAFTAAIEIDPKQADAYIGLADAYAAQGDLGQARKVLEDALAVVIDADAIRVCLNGMEDGLALEPTPEPTQAPTSRATQEPTSELVSEPMVEPGFHDYIIDYIGLTVNDVTNMWGKDFQYADYWLLGAAKPFYYSDARIPFVLCFLDPSLTGKASGEERIIMVEFNPNVVDADAFEEIAPNIPLRANSTQLAELEYRISDISDFGELEFGATTALCLEFNSNVQINFFWLDYADANAVPASVVLIWDVLQ